MSALERLGVRQKIIGELGKKYSHEQEQTKNIFGFKWSKRDTYESDEVKSKMKHWLFERYCSNDKNKLRGWLGEGNKIILDAGCGSGFSALGVFQ